LNDVKPQSPKTQTMALLHWAGCTEYHNND